jgi:hypothetical protein
MGKKTAGDDARELLFNSESEREAHAAAVQALLAPNEALLTNDELIAQELRNQAEFQAEWHGTAAARAVASRSFGTAQINAFRSASSLNAFG